MFDQNNGMSQLQTYVLPSENGKLISIDRMWYFIVQQCEKNCISEEVRYVKS